MLAWLKGAKSTKERYELSPVIASADRSVSETLKQSGSASRKRKRSGNNSYSAEQRAQIADYARQNGNTASARHFRKHSLLKLVRLFCDRWRCQRRLLRYRDANIKIRYDAKLRNSLYMGHA